MNILEKYPLLYKEDSINISKRYEQAWEKAKKASAFLKKYYFAERVILFGSLLDKESFDSLSDIDLGVSGVPDNKFFEAVGKIMEIVSPFEVDLVDINDCRESIKKSILREGVVIWRKKN